MFPADLPAEWRSQAEGLRQFGADDQARTLAWCADRLEEHASAWETEPLTLEEAAQESGYSRDHLGRVLAEGIIPNAGEPYAPRIRRFDLPRKPGHTSESATPLDGPVSSRMQMARSVVKSE
jgi:hypothetical protein